MKRVGLLAITAILGVAHEASANKETFHIYCYDGAFSDVQVDGPGFVFSTWAGHRLSDGEKVTEVHYVGFCEEASCPMSDSVYEPGVLWKTHFIVNHDNNINWNEPGCS